jgi:hypothetical protein
MDEKAKNHKLPSTNETVRVYEGFLTKLFKEANLSVPYYTTVMKELKVMDCVRQIRRGGGGSPSQWLLVQKPSMDLWQGARAKAAPTGRAKFETTTKQQLNDINNRLLVLEKVLGIIS